MRVDWLLRSANLSIWTIKLLKICLVGRSNAPRSFKAGEASISPRFSSLLTQFTNFHLNMALISDGETFVVRAWVTLKIICAS